MRHIKALAGGAPLPTSIQLLIAERWPALRGNLVINPYLEVDAARHLFATRPPVSAVERLVRTTTRVELIEALIEAGEGREKALGALLETWKLSPALQEQLVQRGLSPEIASKLLGAPWVAPGVAEVLVDQASPSEQLRWLYLNDDRVSDLALWGRLRAVCSTGWIMQPGSLRLTALLFRRPALRARAAHSGLPQLASAASALELDVGAQAAVLATWGEQLDERRLLAIGLNMLDRTGTTQEHRDEAYHRLDLLAARYLLAEAGVPGADSPYPVGTPLAEIADHRALELLLLRSAGAAELGLVRGPQWVELAASPHLSVELAERLFAQLGATEVGLSGRPLLLDELQARYPEARLDDEHRRRVLQRLAMPPEQAQVTTWSDYRRPTVLVRGDPPVTGWPDVPFGGNPERAGDVLTRAFGEDRAAWELCFSLLEEFEGSTSELAELVCATLR